MRKIKIRKLQAEKIENSAGGFSIEVKVTTDRGIFSASVPKGTSVGKYEIKDFTKGIDNAIKLANTEICDAIKKIEINTLSDILNFEKKTRKYGGDVVLAVSFSLIKALAYEKRVQPWQLFKPKKRRIPLLLNKMIGGGKHVQWNGPDFQEFLVLGKYEDNLIIHRKIQEFYSTSEKDLEGGWVLEVSNEKALEIIRKQAPDCRLGCDCAASSFYKPKIKRYCYKDGKKLSKKEQIEYIKRLQKEFNLCYIEDPLHEDDFKGFAELSKKIKGCLIVGDDLLATNPMRLKRAIKMKSCNACIVKPNQIGSISKTIEFVSLAKKNNITPIISHRSAETDDNILADIAVGLEIPIIKIGIAGKERLSKIERLIKISKETFNR